MINVISYIIPFLGLIICLVTIFTRKIDTKCSIMVVRLCMLAVNTLYIIEALRPKRKKFNQY